MIWLTWPIPSTMQLTTASYMWNDQFTSIICTLSSSSPSVITLKETIQHLVFWTRIPTVLTNTYKHHTYHVYTTLQPHKGLSGLGAAILSIRHYTGSWSLVMYDSGKTLSKGVIQLAEYIRAYSNKYVVLYLLNIYSINKCY